jgi:hypothetical protein
MDLVEGMTTEAGHTNAGEQLNKKGNDTPCVISDFLPTRRKRD